MGEGGVRLWRPVLPVVLRDMMDMLQKHGDRARQVAEKRARREWRQLGREERVGEDHARLVVNDPRIPGSLSGSIATMAACLSVAG